MREIKFRGRSSKDKKTWFTGSLVYLTDIDEAYIDHYDGLRRVIERYPVNTDTVGQFTGLKDADGREIYEGDVVRCKHDDWAEEDAEIYAVRYFDDLDYPAFELDGWKDGESNGLSYFTVCGEIHVIGNVHDNPDLLEAAHD